MSSLCSATCVSEYDATTQSIKLTMQNDRRAGPVKCMLCQFNPHVCFIARERIPTMGLDLDTYIIIHLYRITKLWHTRILGLQKPSDCFGGLSISCLDRDHLETLRIHSWFAQRMTCVIARNYAQPILHHASPNSIVVWEIRFHEKKDWDHSQSISGAWLEDVRL